MASQPVRASFPALCEAGSWGSEQSVFGRTAAPYTRPPEDDELSSRPFLLRLTLS